MLWDHIFTSWPDSVFVILIFWHLDITNDKSITNLKQTPFTPLTFFHRSLKSDKNKVVLTFSNTSNITFGDVRITNLLTSPLVMSVSQNNKSWPDKNVVFVAWQTEGLLRFVLDLFVSFYYCYGNIPQTSQTKPKVLLRDVRATPPNITKGLTKNVVFCLVKVVLEGYVR